MTRLTRFLRQFHRTEEGSATIEMIILFPVFMALFISSFELGTVMLRQAMLDRGVDMTVRQVRIGAVANVDHDTLKDMICERAGLLANCDTELKLEMLRVVPQAWVGMDADIDCVDQEDYGIPPRTFQAGADNQMMLLRACHLFEPFVANYGRRFGQMVLGDAMEKESGNSYRLVTTAAFVVEPGGT